MHEPLTLYIKHLADSTNIKCVTLNKHCSGLIGNHFEMPNVSYTYPLAAMLKNMKILRKIFIGLFVLAAFP